MLLKSEACCQEKPQHRMKVPQPSGAVLDVGLEELRGVAVLLLTHGEAIQQLLHQRGLVDGIHLFLETRAKRPEQCPVAAQETGFRQGDPRLNIGVVQSQAVVDGARAVADVKAKVKKLVQESLDNTGGSARLIVRKEKHDVRIGTEAEFTPAVTAQRYKTDGRFQGRGDGCVSSLDGPVERVGQGHRGSNSAPTISVFLRNGSKTFLKRGF